jgi:hypothetical protein
MLLSPEIAKQLHEVPESMIKEAAEMMGGKDNGYKQLLKAAQIFRHAGATPIFLSNHDGSSYTVSSEETFNRKLH